MNSAANKRDCGVKRFRLLASSSSSSSSSKRACVYVCPFLFILWSLLRCRSLHAGEFVTYPLSVSWARRCLRCRPFFSPLSAILALHLCRVYGSSVCSLCGSSSSSFATTVHEMPQASSQIKTTPSGGVPPASSLRPILVSPCFPSSTAAVLLCLSLFLYVRQSERNNKHITSAFSSAFPTFQASQRHTGMYIHVFA